MLYENPVKLIISPIFPNFKRIIKKDTYTDEITRKINLNINK